MLVASQPFLEYVSTRIGPARYELYQNIQLQESNKFLKTIDLPANTIPYSGPRKCLRAIIIERNFYDIINSL